MNNNTIKFSKLILSITFLGFFVLSTAQTDPYSPSGYPDECTSVTAGKLATSDGSVITSHTDDSHRTRSWMNIVPAANHDKGSMVPMYKRQRCDTLAMPAYAHIKIGEIPQLSYTHGFINTAYPCMNDQQLAIGESTFGGRSILQSSEGLIDCQRLCQLMLERCSTARQAIMMADELTHQYGWNDAGECLTIADKKEVWHFEILGPGKGKTGAIWVAQRVPDEHISVNANASTIKHIDLDNPDYFMASKNIYAMALDSGWCTSKEDFQFCYAYAPHSRTSLAARRREWRVFDLVAPSLHLDPNAETPKIASADGGVRVLNADVALTSMDTTDPFEIEGAVFLATLRVVFSVLSSPHPATTETMISIPTIAMPVALFLIMLSISGLLSGCEPLRARVRNCFRMIYNASEGPG